MKAARALLLCGALCGSLCGSASAQDETAGERSAEATDQVPDAVSYWRDVRPILQVHCAGCHQPAKYEGDFVLSDYRTLMAGRTGGDPVVVPGRPEESLLLKVVLPADGEPPMMPGEGEPLTPAQAQVLRSWIAEGAADDSPPAQGPTWTPEAPPEYERAPVVTALAWSPDGELLAVSGYHEVLLHRVDEGSPAARLVGLSERIESVAFSPDGSLLAVAGGSPGRMGELQVWDVEPPELVWSVPVTFDCLYGASWSPDGRLVAFGATDTAVRALDVLTGELVLFNGAHDDWVLDTVFSSDGSHLVTVSRDRSMKLIQVAEQQFIDNITSITPGALKGGLMAVDRRPGCDELLVGGADGVPRLYRMYREKARKIGDDFNLIRAFEGMPGRVFDVAFADDGSRLAAGCSHGKGGEVRLYRADAGEPLWCRSTPAGIYAVAIRPGSGQVACAGFDGEVRLLDAGSGEVEGRFVPVPLKDEPGIVESAADRGAEEDKERP